MLGLITAVLLLYTSQGFALLGAALLIMLCVSLSCSSTRNPVLHYRVSFVKNPCNFIGASAVFLTIAMLHFWETLLFLSSVIAARKPSSKPDAQPWASMGPREPSNVNLVLPVDGAFLPMYLCHHSLTQETQAFKSCGCICVHSDHKKNVRLTLYGILLKND